MSESKSVKTVSDQSFGTEVLASKGVTLVDFWAEWCGPCRQLSPTIDALAQEFEGRVDVRKLNVDENPETPTRYHIRGIPTILMFRDGRLVDQIVGAVPKDVLKRAIETQLQ